MHAQRMNQIENKLSLKIQEMFHSDPPKNDKKEDKKYDPKFLTAIRTRLGSMIKLSPSSSPLNSPDGRTPTGGNTKNLMLLR